MKIKNLAGFALSSLAASLNAAAVLVAIRTNHFYLFHWAGVVCAAYMMYQAGTCVEWRTKST